MSNKLLNFKSHECFYTYINNLLPAFDVRNSVARGRYTFIYNGEVKPYRNLYLFLGELNSLLEADLFNIKSSRITSRTRYKIFVDSEVEANLKTVIVTPVEDVEEGLPEVPELISLDAKETEEVEVVVEEESTPEFEIDWEWIESLEDTKEDKLLLDEYAEKNSNVKLKRTMKLKNMVAAYKEELSV